MSDERHISDLISDNEKIYVELRSVVGQLKMCVKVLQEISDLDSDQLGARAFKALEKVDQKYK